MKMAESVGVVTTVLLALGCASCVAIDRRDYPKDWSPVRAAVGPCPNLTGSYANRGYSGTEESLAQWILPKTTYPLERIERVSIVGPVNGIVTVRLMEGPSLEAAAREWKQDVDYRCDNGSVVLSLQGFFAPLPAFGYSKEARLTRTVDGQLVVETAETGAGVIVFVPGYKNVRRWHLYPVAAE